MTNQGLSITLPCVTNEKIFEKESLIAILNCKDLEQPGQQVVGVYLRLLSTPKEANAYLRVFSNIFCTVAQKILLEIFWKELLIPRDPERWLAKETTPDWRAEGHSASLKEYKNSDTSVNMYAYTGSESGEPEEIYKELLEEPLSCGGSPPQTASGKRDKAKNFRKHLTRVWEVVKDTAVYQTQ
jgi:hypothetical protein